MKTVNESELKRIQLEILDAVHNFCIENKINYWLDSGTLIGAVRHKGYIPWDDDIDLGMLRPDYDKFLKLFNEKNTRYKCYSIENNEKFYYPFAKIIDTKTVLYEPDEKGNKLAINIDLFPYDKTSTNEKEIKKMYQLRDKYQKERSLCHHSIHSGGFIRKALIKIISIPYKFFPKAYFDKKIVKNSKKFDYLKENFLIGNFTSYNVIAVNPAVFDSFVDLEFEKKFYKVPIGYDEWLKAFYGDYMTLPPESERVSRHNFKAYILEDNE